MFARRNAFATLLVRGALALLAVVICPQAARSCAIATVDAGSVGFVGLSESGPLDAPVPVESLAEFIATFGGSTAGLPLPYLAPAVAAYFANGGQRLFVVRVAGADDTSLIGSDGGAIGLRTGLQALRDVDEVSAIAVPGASSPSVQAAMIALCESTGDRMALLDPAGNATIDAVMQQRAGLTAAAGHAALYYPWIQAAPLEGTQLLPPSGFVAGIYARTAIPQSPTGSVATASGVAVALTSTQADALNQAGVDPIRSFVGMGVQVWGARTLSPDVNWRYVMVRRMALVLEESIAEGTQWALLQPNDAALWADLRICVEDFMLARFQAGWFQGITAQQAFFVRVDATTMTQQDIDEGRTIILVGFAALRPAEFVLLRIVLQRDLATATPTGASGLARLYPASPNPFTPSTSLRFELAAPGRVEARVYDLAGRRVRTLRSGDDLAAGAHRLWWDGRAEDGAPVASGTYVVRLSIGDQIQTQRVSVLR